MPWWAQAQETDIQTTYSIEKGACGRGAQSTVEFTEGSIVGPGFDCRISNGRSAGTGLVAYDATYAIHGKESSHSLALDLGNYTDHFDCSNRDQEPRFTPDM